jgi:hypothetical protein
MVSMNRCHWESEFEKMKSCMMLGRYITHRNPCELDSNTLHQVLILLDLQVGMYLLAGRIPAKATKHLKQT